MNIYIGNLSFNVTEEELKGIFAEFGEVTGVKIITDAYTGRSRGFGFVEMQNQAEGEAAVTGLNETPMKGRNLLVNEARPRTDKPRRKQRY